MLDFKQALSRSVNQFNLGLRGELQKILKGEFEVVEGLTADHLAKLLDMLAGIDVWHIDKLNGIRGIALRIQTGQKDWHTFTIRAKRDSGARTELEKRRYAIAHNYLYPYLTVQAYISDNDKLISFAVAKTEDIIAMIDKGLFQPRRTGKDKIGQADFYAVDWYEMKSAGYKVVVHK